MRDYQIGQRLEVHVLSIHSHGIFITLPDSRRGYIRRRNLSLSSRIDPSQFSIGDKISADVISLEGGIELSHKDTLPDPWNTIDNTLAVGEIIEARVTSTDSTKAYLEIIPGISAVVHQNQIAPWKVHQIEKELFSEDIVEGVITSIDTQKREIVMSLRNRVYQYMRVSNILYVWHSSVNQKQQEVVYQDDTATTDEDAPIFVPNSDNGRVLIVDDIQEIAHGIAAWLEYRGWSVDTAFNTKDAIEKIDNQAYSLIILDLNLGPDDGVRVLDYLATQQTHPPVIVISIPTAVYSRKEKLRRANVSAVLYKSFSFDKLDAEIFACMTNPEHRANLEDADEIYLKDRVRVTFALMQSDTPPAQRLHHILTHHLDHHMGDMIVLFEHHIANNTFSARLAVGKKYPPKDTVNLQYSPVYNVITDKEPIWVTDVERSDTLRKRFDYLLQMFTFRACIGIPVYVHDDVHHAIFVFFDTPYSVSDVDFQAITATSTLISTILETEIINRRNEQLSAIITKGELTERLLHEVRNSMQTLRASATNLAKKQDAQTISKQINEKLNELNHTIETFENTKGQIRLEPCDLRHTIISVIELMKYVANQREIEMTSRLGEAFSAEVITSRIAIQQVLINILLNAIQHIALLRERMGISGIKTKSTTLLERKGIIEIDLQKNTHHFQIRVRDNGPGIHFNHWNKIFLPGFTTRDDGSGLGLSIARSFLRSVGGDLHIEKSIIFVGTTFVITIPIKIRGDI